MEMVEQQNQPPKRLKIDETLEQEEDHISDLPDAVILHILSLLPETKDAITTGTLSKRWVSLWTLTPTLVFSHSLYNYSTCDFVSIVNKTLSQRPQSKLIKFRIFMDYDAQFEAQFNNWIRYAVSCDVEELNIAVMDVASSNQFLLHDEFFINPCFTDLKLSGFKLNPTGAVNWKELRSLSISQANLDEDLIQNILSGSPELKTLVLDNCYGFRRLDITSKSVENLVLSGYGIYTHVDLWDVIEINAPNILSLKILYDLLLWKVFLLNVSSLVEANVDYIKHGHPLTLHKEEEEEMLKGFIQSLRHVKEIKVGILCSKVVSRLEAKGFIFPPNMKFPDTTTLPASYFDAIFLGDEDPYDSD